MIMRMIDADKMATDELAAFISAQAKIADAAKGQTMTQKKKKGGRKHEQLRKKGNNPLA